MSLKVMAGKTDPFADRPKVPTKVDSSKVKSKVLEILREPSKADAKEIVQRATYGDDPFDTFDPIAFHKGFKGTPTP